MEQINEILSRTIVALGGISLTWGDLVLVPSLLLAFYLGARWLGRNIVKRMARAEASPDLIHLVQRVYLIAVIAVLALTVLQLLDVPLGAFAFVSGAVAIGVGFGAQNIINNFISGWILMWEKPIRINDFLEIGATMGTVEAINTRSTRIRRVDGVHLLIPNS
jgi:small-conductance mechanosensitive channel